MRADSLTCPVCHDRLTRSDSALVCPAGHSFDVAREGYVNLLLRPKGARPITGDTAQMLGARRRFLEGGFYRPLLDGLVGTAQEALGDRDQGASGPPLVLEVGSGEGYYIGGIANGIGSATGAAFVGADVSKAAARLAARRYPDVSFFVADVHRRICVPDASVSLLLDVFAPRDPEEFARVLEPGGSVLVVIPSPSHLAGLRSELGLLQIEEDKEARLLDRFSAHFMLADRREIEFEIQLPPEAVGWQVDMGPNHWHAHGTSMGRHVADVASFVVLRLRHRVGVKPEERGPSRGASRSAF